MYTPSGFSIGTAEGIAQDLACVLAMIHTFLTYLEDDVISKKFCFLAAT